MQEEKLEIPKITFKDIIRYIFPISMVIVFWFLVHTLNYGVTFKELLIGFIEFIIQVGAMFAIYLFSKLLIEWFIKKIGENENGKMP